MNAVPTFQPSLRNRLFYLIRHHDVELAEAFMAKCPETDNVSDLNRFFRLLFSQHNLNTRDVRVLLDDTMPSDDWLSSFQQDVLPVLLTWRFPPDTRRNARPIYDSQ